MLIHRNLLSLVIVLLLLSPAHAGDLPSSGRLSPEQATALLAQPPAGLTILDVRTRDEFQSGHAPGALHIPVAELSARIGEVPAGPVLILCRSGRRANGAYEILVRSGRAPESLWFLSGYTDYSSGNMRFYR